MTDSTSLTRQRYAPEFKLRLVHMALKTLEENGSVAALVPVQIVHPLPAQVPLPDATADCIIRLPGGEISLHNPTPEQLSAMLSAIMRGGRP